MRLTRSPPDYNWATWPIWLRLCQRVIVEDVLISDECCNLSLLASNKKTHKYVFSYQLLGCGQGNKALNSQASYHALPSVLTKATGDANGGWL